MMMHLLSSSHVVDEAVDRRETRDSLFLMGTLRRPDGSEVYKIRIRNLSSGGLMADAAPKLTKGEAVLVTLKTIGELGGTVAWATGNRIGIAFDQRVDPGSVRLAMPGHRSPAGAAAFTVAGPRGSAPKTFGIPQYRAPR